MLAWIRYRPQCTVNYYRIIMRSKQNERRNSQMLTINTFYKRRCRDSMSFPCKSSTVQLIAHHARSTRHTSMRAHTHTQTSRSRRISLDAEWTRLLPRVFGPSCFWCVRWISTRTSHKRVRCNPNSVPSTPDDDRTAHICRPWMYPNNSPSTFVCVFSLLCGKRHAIKSNLSIRLMRLVHHYYIHCIELSPIIRKAIFFILLPASLQ